MIPFVGLPQIQARYRDLRWFERDDLYRALNDGYDIFTEDGVTPLRNYIAGSVDDPVWSYLVGKP
jgi:hypothetical protein